MKFSMVKVDRAKLTQCTNILSVKRILLLLLLLILTLYLTLTQIYKGAT